MKYFFQTLLFALLFNLNAFAVEQKVVTITSDIEKYKTEFFLEIKEDGSIDSMRFISTYPNGQIFEDYTHTSENVIDDGVVIVERSGRKVLKLLVENFTVVEGGGVKLDYLFNGLEGTRRNLKIKLLKVNDKFTLTNIDGKPIKSISIIGNRTVILGVIGIREIRLNY